MANMNVMHGMGNFTIYNVCVQLHD